MKYLATKIVSAVPMTRGDHQLSQSIALEDSQQNEEGYQVTYEDNCVSWCPKETFEKHNRPLDALTFGMAVEALKKGFKVARTGWNGKDMFLYYVPEAKYPATNNTNSSMVGVFPDDMVPYQAYIAMKTAQGIVVPWQPSQSDVLTEDWVVVKLIST